MTAAEPILGLPYPLSTDPPDGPTQIQALATAAAKYGVGRYASTSAASTAYGSSLTAGILAYITGSSAYYYYNGSSWVALLASPTNVPAIAVGRWAPGSSTGYSSTSYTSLGTAIDLTKNSSSSSILVRIDASCFAPSGNANAIATYGALISGGSYDVAGLKLTVTGQNQAVTGVAKVSSSATGTVHITAQLKVSGGQVNMDATNVVCLTAQECV